MTRAASIGAPRRGLRRPEAAAYVGVSISKFDQLVTDGRMPAPLHLDNIRLWDVRDLDAAFDRLHEPLASADDSGGW